LVVLLILCLSGCLSPAEQKWALQQQASPYLGCPATRVKVSEPGVYPVQAQGCDREVVCSWNGPSTTGTWICQETPDSSARTEQKVVVDRLALETACPREQIQVVERANWSRGGEAAFRMWACGVFYACTTAPGRTECKPLPVVSPPQP
jgi:hypothetical protein